MSGFQVGVTALRGPAQRLKQIATDLGVAGSGAASAAGDGGAAAGSPSVSGAADVFRAGVQAVLATLADDAGLLGDKVQKAGVTYDVTDRTAMPVTPGGSTPGGSTPGRSTPGGSTPGGSRDSGGSTQPAGTAPDSGPPPAPATVHVARGDSLWSIAARRLGPGATPAAVSAEWHRWHAANRDVIGPDPDRLLAGTTLRAPDPDGR
jgi:resuscitation-promoting factor RpfA